MSIYNKGVSIYEQLVINGVLISVRLEIDLESKTLFIRHAKIIDAERNVNELDVILAVKQKKDSGISGLGNFS